jgi:hypothetical protein
MRRRSSYLDDLQRQGVMPQFYDPEGTRYGTPTFPYHYAPKGLMTRRQLRAANLAPGGHDPIAQILWKHREGTRRAFLYDSKLAVPKRTPTQAQLDAVRKATTARKICPSCGVEQPYCLPKSLGECLDCAEGARKPPEPEADREAA